MTKPTKWHVCPTKTQISLGVRPVWSESLLCTQWVAKDPSSSHMDSEESDQTGWMPRLIWVFTGRTCHFVIPRHTKSGGVLCYTLRKFWVLFHPSTLRFQTLTWEFLTNFFKLCMNIDIGEEWFGIANGLNSFINNRVMAVDWCKNVVSGLLTWEVIDRFSSNFEWTLISGKSGLGLQMG